MGSSDTAMATKHGSIGDLDAGSEDWESYPERREQYFVRDDRGGSYVTAAAKKRAVLQCTHHVGASTTPKQQEEGTLGGGKRRADCKIAHSRGRATWGACSEVDSTPQRLV